MVKFIFFFLLFSSSLPGRDSLRFEASSLFLLKGEKCHLTLTLLSEKSDIKIQVSHPLLQKKSSSAKMHLKQKIVSQEGQKRRIQWHYILQINKIGEYTLAPFSLKTKEGRETYPLHFEVFPLKKDRAHTFFSKNASIKNSEIYAETKIYLISDSKEAPFSLSLPPLPGSLSDFQILNSSTSASSFQQKGKKITVLTTNWKLRPKKETAFFQIPNQELKIFQKKSRKGMPFLEEKILPLSFPPLSLSSHKSLLSNLPFVFGEYQIKKENSSDFPLHFQIFGKGNFISFLSLFHPSWKGQIFFPLKNTATTQQITFHLYLFPQKSSSLPLQFSAYDENDSEQKHLLWRNSSLPLTRIPLTRKWKILSKDIFLYPYPAKSMGKPKILPRDERIRFLQRGKYWHFIQTQNKQRGWINVSL